MNDNHGVTALAMYPKQPFDFTGRTGTISFDVSNDTFGTHDAWPEVWITDQPVPAPMAHFQPCDTCSLPRNGVGIRLASFLVAGQGAQEPNCPNDANGHWFPDSVVVTRNYIQQEFPMIVNNVRQTTGCVTSSPGPNGPLNHVEIRISQNQVDVWASDAGSTALKHLASIPNLNLSFTKGVVWLEDVHYNASKAFGASGTADGPHTNHTFTWDNLAFDGPSVARDFTLDVHDAQSACCGGLLNLGFNSSPSSPAKLTTDPATAAQIAAASAALLVFTFSYDPITTFNYTVNGRAFSAPSPFTPQTASSKSLALPIPLTALVPGPQQITIAGDTGMIVSNVDVILVGAGGGGGTTAPPPPPPDAGPPPPADGGVALAPSPAGLAGTAKATVNVTWTAVSGATGYVIRRGTSATGAFTTVGTPTQPSFSDTTVAFATTYLYTVATVNAAGEGAESNPISVPVP